ncbi:VQ motif-containing protein [Corchorus capsularis]|uniref:VQ motif-containing protein n=1 Tax=Corchorus capsularis TaxID=210143 RepID=A0A1R3KA01_COCAP|nr:VQ motif-containing protein [Corchorus capsularis]
MDNNYPVNSLQQSKKGKSKKKKNNNSKPAVKVVYISNPMKLKISASKFRAIVQELTGQDAELPTDPTKFTDTDDDNDGDCGGGGGYQKVPDAPLVQEVPRVEQADEQRPSISSTVESFEEAFITPQMLENLTGYFPPSLLL